VRWHAALEGVRYRHVLGKKDKKEEERKRYRTCGKLCSSPEMGSFSSQLFLTLLLLIP